MELIKIDPRLLHENPDPTRRTAATLQADALMVASLKATGLIQPPVVYATPGSPNSLTIHVGSRRVRNAIKADLAEIPALLIDPETEGGLMAELAENVVREGLNPVDLWRSIERLVAQGWSEDAIATALALPVRHVRKLRLLASILPAMLDFFAKGQMPKDNELREIAAATLEEQAAVWKKHKPTKANPNVSWHNIAHMLRKDRMYARNGCFDDDLARAYGITWTEDLFAPADQDSRYTTDVAAFLGAQKEWMANHVPKNGALLETNSWGAAKLPPKAERIYGEPKKSDRIGLFLGRDGSVQKIAYRMPPAKTGKKGNGAAEAGPAHDMPKVPRADVTRKGHEMIGQFRTEALHEALRSAPIEADTLLALMVLAVARRNVSVRSGSGGNVMGFARLDQHVDTLLDEKGRLDFDRETLNRAARLVLIELFSCNLDATNSGVASVIAGEAIGADTFLPNMATEEYLSCLSRPALEAVGSADNVLPRPRVRDTRAAIVTSYATRRFVHKAARFIPDPGKIAELRKGVARAHELADRVRSEDDEVQEDRADEPQAEEADADSGDSLDADSPYRIAAE